VQQELERLRGRGEAALLTPEPPPVPVRPVELD
jgi:hypothetical protein